MQKRALFATFFTLFAPFYTFFNTFLSLFDRFLPSASFLIDAIAKFHPFHLAQTTQINAALPPFLLQKT